eukprot:1138616-Pelagomonas_calceolata.AAC.3
MRGKGRGNGRGGIGMRFCDMARGHGVGKHSTPSSAPILCFACDPHDMFTTTQEALGEVESTSMSPLKQCHEQR